MDQQLTLRDFFELWPLFGDATLTGMFAGAALGILGVHVVLRRMVFLTAAISQSASLGVMLAIALSSVAVFGLLTPTLGALLMTIVTLWAVQRARQSSRDFSDAVLGVMYLAGAAGTLVLGTRVHLELHDLTAMLSGTAVAVVPEDFRAVAITSVVLVAIHLAWWRGFAAVTTDRQDAQVRDLPVRALDLTLMLSIALMISVSTRVLGPLPTFAFSILPAVAALRVAWNIPSSLVVAAVVGAMMGFVGYVIATLYSLPVGPAQTCLGLALVLAADVFARARAVFRPKVSPKNERAVGA